MKICCIIHSLGLGGMERVMSILLHEFASYDSSEVHLMLIGRTREVLWELPKEVHIYKPKWDFNNKFRVWHTMKTLRFIRSKVNDIQPDCILSFGELWNNLVLLSLCGTRYPVFVADRSKPNKDLGRVQNLLRKFLYPRAAGFIAQTSQAAEVADKQKWNTNIEVIGNPVPKIKKGQNRENIILNVGRLIPTKNIDRLMAMFRSMNYPDHWRLVIIGGNAKRLHLLEKYREQVEDWNAAESIELLGQEKEVIPFYQKAKIFAFTSTSEGFPNALAEAMAAGCACIAYDCAAGPSDIIDDGINGFLIPVGDEEKYKEKLRLLMEDSDLRRRFGVAAREKMKEFEAGKIARRFYDFLLGSEI